MTEEEINELIKSSNITLDYETNIHGIEYDTDYGAPVTLSDSLGHLKENTIHITDLKDVSISIINDGRETLLYVDSNGRMYSNIEHELVPISKPQMEQLFQLGSFNQCDEDDQMASLDGFEENHPSKNKIINRLLASNRITEDEADILRADSQTRSKDEDRFLDGLDELDHDQNYHPHTAPSIGDPNTHMVQPDSGTHQVRPNPYTWNDSVGRSERQLVDPRDQFKRDYYNEPLNGSFERGRIVTSSGIGSINLQHGNYSAELPEIKKIYAKTVPNPDYDQDN